MLTRFHTKFPIMAVGLGLLLASMAPVKAQEAAQQVGTIEEGVVPLFTLPNWEGGAQSEDLYETDHPAVWQPWNTYQLQVQQIALQSAAVGTNASLSFPTPVSTIGGPLPTHSASAASTSVTGVVLP